jgi:hypothetical protein
LLPSDDGAGAGVVEVDGGVLDPVIAFDAPLRESVL